MPLPTPFTAPPIPSSDILSFLFDKPPTDYEESRIMFKDNNPNSLDLTYKDLRTSLRKFGHGLHDIGVRQGHLVGILMLHGVHYPIAFFGVLCAGAQAVLMNPQYPAQDVVKYIKMTGLQTIIVDSFFMKTIEEVLISLPDLSVIVRGKFQANDSLQSVFQFDELLGATELAWPRDASIHRSPAMICFSSGTSGFPKGVILTHRNLVAMQHMYYYATHHAARMQNGGKLHNTVLNVFPPFHSGGVVGSIIDPIYDGSTSVVMQQFQFDKFLDMIEKYRPTNIMLAPPVVLLLATHSLVQGRDFSSVKRITAGAAPLSKELAEACVKRLNSSIRLNQTWGMTELTCAATGSSFTMEGSDNSDRKPGSVGYPLPGLSIKLVKIGTEEEIMPADVVDLRNESQRGEILVKGPTVFAWYTQHTRKDMAANFTEDGYYKTGDVAVADKDGCLWIVDRTKELIKSSGFQVAPAEIEGLLLTHPDIVDCAVVGVPDPIKKETSELVRAYIVLRPGSVLDQNKPEEAIALIQIWYNPQVAGYKRLTGGIHFVQEVPKSPSGKILRQQLRNQIAAEQSVHRGEKL